MCHCVIGYLSNGILNYFKRFKQRPARMCQTTERLRYGEICSYRRSRLL